MSDLKFVFVEGFVEIDGLPKKGSKVEPVSIPVLTDAVSDKFAEEMIKLLPSNVAIKDLMPRIKSFFGMRPTDPFTSAKPWSTALALFKKAAERGKIGNDAEHAAVGAITWSLVLLEAAANPEVGADLTKKDADIFSDVQTYFLLLEDESDTAATEIAEDPTTTADAVELTVINVNGNALKAQLDALKKTSSGIKKVVEGLKDLAEGHDLGIQAVELTTEAPTNQLPAGNGQKVVKEVPAEDVL
jgi:hypothetical protein